MVDNSRILVPKKRKTVLAPLVTFGLVITSNVLEPVQRGRSFLRSIRFGGITQEFQRSLSFFSNVFDAKFFLYLFQGFSSSSTIPQNASTGKQKSRGWSSSPTKASKAASSSSSSYRLESFIATNGKRWTYGDPSKFFIF
jgi:hypothetical protein